MCHKDIWCDDDTSSITAWRSDDCIKRSSHSSDCCLILSSILYILDITRDFYKFDFISWIFCCPNVSSHNSCHNWKEKKHKEEYFIRHFDLKGHLLYLEDLGFIMISSSLIMFICNFFHLFANPRWTELNQTSIDSKVFSRCYIKISLFPLNTLFKTLLRQTNIVNINNIGTMRICRTFTKTLVHYPMCELYYSINCQSNHVSMEVKFYAEQKIQPLLCGHLY